MTATALAAICLIAGQQAHDGLRFRDVSGACQGSSGDGLLWDTALGWDRHDLSWAHCEPVAGEWHPEVIERFGQRVLAAKAKGVQVLPVLAYNAPWSWDRGERTYAHGDLQWHVVPRQDGQFNVSTAQRRGDRWVVTKHEIAAGGGMWPLAAEHVLAWQQYVRRVVEVLHAPPYQVECFQVWNEAHPLSGFWFGDLDSYLERVHLPAARVIRSLGGKVVYGGWPCCGSLDEYLSLLDRHAAWDTLDVLDVHYFGLGAFQRLYEAASAHGGKAIWQTEVGFMTDAEFVPNTWPRFLHWAVAHSDRPWPDRYKLFQFAYWSPDDAKAYGYDKCLLSGDHLSVHGQALQTLAELFGDAPIRAYDDLTTEPALTADLDGANASLEAFSVPGRIVVALHVAGAPAVVHLPRVAPGTVKGAEQVSAVGERTPLKPVPEHGGVRLDVPPAAGITCYVVVDLEP